MAEKCWRRVNMVQKVCTHVCKCKNGTNWNHSRRAVEGVNFYIDFLLIMSQKVNKFYTYHLLSLFCHKYK
jgi:hypothetical protein